VTDAAATEQQQRARILQAAVEIAAERGAGATTVARVIERARVSRRTFYELYGGGLEECFIAILDDGLKRATAVVVGALEEHESWRTGLRAAIAALLELLDSDPARTRVWLIEAPGAGPGTLEHRERNKKLLRKAILRSQAGAHDDMQLLYRQAPPSAAEGVIASLFGMIQARILTGGPGSLVDLLGPLVGVATAPYLDPAGVRREVAAAERLAARMRARRDSPAGRPRVGRHVADPRSAVATPSLLANPRSQRARACMLHLAEHPGDGA